MNIKTSQWVLNKIHRERKDFILATFRCGGKGGQNVNKVETGVRITDKITGIACEGREERSQLQNRNRAFERLIKKLVEYYEAEERAQAINYKSDVVVRTYNDHDNRVKDHRTGQEYSYKQILDGKLDPMIKDLHFDDFNQVD